MQIDLLLRPRPRRIAVLIVAISFLAVAVGSAATALRHYQAAEGALEDLRHLQATRKKPAPPKPKLAEIEANKRWTAMRAEFSFSWYPIFRALENANTPDIELLEFLPDKVGRRLVLRGEARDQAALSNYTSALAQQTAFSAIYLAHQKVVRKQGMEVLAFEIRSALSE